MTDHLLALIAAHFACAEVSDTRPLSYHEIDRCGAIYQEIKLHFVPDMDRQTYHRLSIEDKVSVNRQGFDAFIAWREQNPHLVAHLEDVARGKAKLAITT